ncbi:MAG TPA: hypothetical protein VJ552_06635 [Sediminibacterium sp.]|nr:hypothetical protein [Sediminibacterium sp.]
MKRFIKQPFCIIAILSLVFLASCSKDSIEPDPSVDYIQLGSGFATGTSTHVEVYATDSAFTGYNKLYVLLKDSASGRPVDNAVISLNPMMAMTGMSHSAPKENPVSNIAINHFFPCSVSFIMPSTAGTWTLGVQVQNLENGKSGTASVTIGVKDPVYAKMFSFKSLADNSTTYFVGYVEPSRPIVGINDLELVIYKKQTMMTFPADSSLSVLVTPEMPTMNHGSPNNIDPVHIINGHYKGKVNFTMTGLWRLNLKLKSGATVVDSTHYIDLTF